MNDWITFLTLVFSSKTSSFSNNFVDGDVTTIATVLAHTIVKSRINNVATGSNPIYLKVGLAKGTKCLREQKFQSILDRLTILVILNRLTSTGVGP